MNKIKSLSFRVSVEEHGVRLLAFLRGRCPEGLSVKAIKRAIDSRGCTINGRMESFSTHVVKGGDLVILRLQEQEPVLTPTILYEDEHLLICNKPAGMVSENVVFPHKPDLIHRLDKDTSGALMLAKTKEMKEQMIALFKLKQVRKFYLAVVDKNVKEPHGKIEQCLVKKHQYQGQTIWGTAERGLSALTYWECLKQMEDSSLLLCEPVTGRTHQLRVHLSSIGHPIVGDYQYAKRFKCAFKASRQLLHAHRLVFTHPLSKKPIDLKAPLERIDMAHLVQFLDQQ
jgi:23S rRNA pseudouridine955/2504/2580 synthase